MQFTSPCKDTLTIRNGGSASSPLILSDCKVPQNKTFISTGNLLRLRFKTDGSGDGKGFRSTWNTIVKGEMCINVSLLVVACILQIIVGSITFIACRYAKKARGFTLLLTAQSVFFDSSASFFFFKCFFFFTLV